MKELAVLVFVTAGIASALGTPHLLVQHSCQFAFGHCMRQDIECLYVGVQGYRRMFPALMAQHPDSCPGVTMMPLEWPLFQWH